MTRMENTMRDTVRTLLAAAGVALAVPAFAQGPRPIPNNGIAGPDGAPSGRAPWNATWEYDSGSDNDRRPELPYYQQGRGQQTGGPARNLLPDDRLQIFPR